MKSIKICRVKMTYLDHFFSQKLSVPCFHEYYGEFFFNWSLETAKQFIKHLMTMQPTKFYITSSTETSVIPFIVGKNFEEVLPLSLKYFCLENEGREIITKDEFGLFLDCFFRAVHCIANFNVEDNVYQKTKDNLIKLSENELDDLLDNIFIDENKNKIDKMELNKLTINIPENLLKILKNINEGFHSSMTYYENKIKEQNKI